MNEEKIKSQFEAWWSDFKSTHEDWPFADKEALLLCAYQAALASQAQQPTDLSKQLREYAADSGYSHNDYADTMLAAASEIERLTASQAQQPELAKNQSCGCVICTCEHETQCQGCGAKHCGTHAVGDIPNPAYLQSQLSSNPLQFGSQAQQSQWMSVDEAKSTLKDGDLIYVAFPNGAVSEAVYRLEQGHYPHRIISDNGNERIEHCTDVMLRKTVPLPPAPECEKS